MNSLATGVLLGLLVLPAYAEDPSSKGVNFYSLAKEIELGQQEAAALERALPVVHEPKLDAYIAKLSAELANYADRRFPYTFTFYEDRRPMEARPVPIAMPGDAFQDRAIEPVALPGGPIFVPMSLLAGAPDEAAFAFQLSHAMAHVALRHATRMATRWQIANVAAAPLQNSSLGPDAASNQRKTMQLGSGNLARLFETQADIVATGILAAAGYDPQAVVRDLQEQPAAGRTTMSRVFSLHPTSEGRVKTVRTRIQELPAQVYTAGTGEFGEVKAIAAIVAQVPHQHHTPSSAEYAKVLEDPSRDEWQKPHEVVMALDLKSTGTIADIGAGTGYFARRFAQHAGKVYAVDIDEKLLAIARENAPPNLETILAAPDDPRLPAGKIDTIFFCDVLHHIENRPAYYAKLVKALRPEGTIVVIDFYKKDLPVGPPPAMKLSDEEVIGELRNAGFTLARRLDILPYQYFLFFEKRK